MTNARSASPRRFTIDVPEKLIEQRRSKWLRKNRKAVLINCLFHFGRNDDLDGLDEGLGPSFALCPRGKSRVIFRAGNLSAGTAATNAIFSGVTCNIDLPDTCTKLNSRAASRAFTASFIFDRGTKLLNNDSSSACSTANPIPPFPPPGAHRESKSHDDPSLAE